MLRCTSPPPPTMLNSSAHLCQLLRLLLKVCQLPCCILKLNQDERRVACRPTSRLHPLPPARHHRVQPPNKVAHVAIHTCTPRPLRSMPVVRQISNGPPPLLGTEACNGAAEIFNPLCQLLLQPLPLRLKVGIIHLQLAHEAIPAL